jgi:uncharacterized protein involved in type VI secretion and phage assembly
MNREPVFDRPPGWMHAGYLARVVSLDDPDRRNRVQVRLIAFDDVDNQDAPMWARVVAPFAGSDRGVFFLPDVDDEVFVVFMNGDARFPVILGGLWNGNASSPADIESGGTNRYKRIKSKNGVVITMDDQQGQETLHMETPGGQKVTLQDGPGTIIVEDSNGNSVKLESAGITINASAKVTVSASQLAISAGMVTVDAGMSKFSGVVQADTVISNSVVSASYTPGAGNIW